MLSRAPDRGRPSTARSWPTRRSCPTPPSSRRRPLLEQLRVADARGRHARGRIDRYSERMADSGHGRGDGPRSVAECLDELHHNIEGMVKVPRLPSALRLMLTQARAQIDE